MSEVKPESSSPAAAIAPLRKMFLASLALGLGLADAARYVTQPWWVRWTRDDPVARLLEPSHLQVLLVVAKYIAPGLAFYFVLRLLRVERWLRPNGAIEALLWIANAALIIYTVPRVLSMLVPGGGATYVVMMIAPFVVFAAYALYLAASLWLVVRSARGRFQFVPPLRWTRGEAIGFVIALLCVAAPVAPIVIGPDAAYPLARALEREFASKCESAGARVLGTVSTPARGLFLDPDSATHYGDIRRGSPRWSSSGALGGPLLDEGYLLFYERPASGSRDASSRFTRHAAGDRDGTPVDTLESEYGVFRRELSTASDQQRGLLGYEVSVRTLPGGEPVATSAYFFQKRLGRFCGNAPSGHFREDLWIIETLRLRPHTFAAAAGPGQR